MFEFYDHRYGDRKRCCSTIENVCRYESVCSRLPPTNDKFPALSNKLALGLCIIRVNIFLVFKFTTVASSSLNGMELYNPKPKNLTRHTALHMCQADKSIFDYFVQFSKGHTCSQIYTLYKQGYWKYKATQGVCAPLIPENNALISPNP